ncbi:MAG: ribosome silencing factor [Bdellovibrionales bacterium]
MASTKGKKTKTAKNVRKTSATGKTQGKVKSAPRKPPGRAKAAKRPQKSAVKKTAKPTSRKLAQGAQKAVVKILQKKPVPSAPARPAGMPEMLRDAAIAVLNERQAEDVLTFDLAERSAMADYLIVASGRASKQLVAIAHYLGEAFVKLGMPKPRIEGMQDANWVLVDAGDVIVHLFRPEVRKYYDLEAIWQEK